MDLQDAVNVALPALFEGYEVKPALVHGDLWGGNVAAVEQRDQGGKAGVFYDPAPYFGDRESDLAMTELFGGFPDVFYDAYETVLPLDKGYQERKALYQLYHVLNHFNIFDC